MLRTTHVRLADTSRGSRVNDELLRRKHVTRIAEAQAAVLSAARMGGIPQRHVIFPGINQANPLPSHQKQSAGLYEYSCVCGATRNLHNSHGRGSKSGVDRWSHNKPVVSHPKLELHHILVNTITSG
jgi:hypothetical protein